MLVKVCGMREINNIKEISSLDIDYMGFIYYPYSPRYIGDRLQNLKHNIPEKICTTGVFVNSNLCDIIKIAKRDHLKAIQLHGNESPSFCNLLQVEGFKVIKALSIKDETDIKKAHEYLQMVDLLVFDTASKQYGGSGLQFDWDLLRLYEGEKNFLLSGGIQPESVSAIQKIKHPALAGVDLNSGFEISPGIKDAQLLSMFIEQIKK